MGVAGEGRGLWLAIPIRPVSGGNLQLHLKAALLRLLMQSIVDLGLY